MQNSCAPYTPRNPRLSDYYRCVEDYFEELERVHEDRYQARFGYLRPEIRFTIFRYLDCGCLQNGFARVRCDDCGHEYLVAFSCKRRHFCRSCHQKREIGFNKWFLDELAVTVPHRYIVFSIPKLIRRCFLFDRTLLADLSRANWARLIQKIYEIDPLTCPKCNGTMRILAFIEEAAVIRNILDHLGLWDVPKRQPHRGRGPPVTVVVGHLLVYADSQIIGYEEAYYIPEYLS
jgi:hypothetical protein